MKLFFHRAIKKKLYSSFDRITKARKARGSEAGDLLLLGKERAGEVIVVAK